MNTRSAAWLALAAMLCSGPALAQENAADQAEQPTQTESFWEDWSPTWTDSAIGEAAEALTGAWRTTAPVGEAGGDADGEVDMLMLIDAVPVSGVPNALYVEQYREDAPTTPFRQSIMSFYRFKDQIRLRTYEIIRDEDGKGVLVGMGMFPEGFPELSRDELIATLDLNLDTTEGGFKGQTPYPYPTGVGGAVEMTSEISVSGDTMRTADRGYDAQGDVVWGSGENATYDWTRSAPWADVEKKDSGLVIITLHAPEDDTPEPGGRVFVHYEGWTADANKFDSSRDKGQPWPLQWPVSEMRVIEGWKQGFEGIRKGTFRKLVIPPSLAYGEGGVPRAGIGPNAVLYFNTEIMAVQAPPPAPEEAGEGEPEENGDGDN